MYRIVETGSGGEDRRRVPVLNAEEARQGETSGHVRVILASSLALAAIVFVVLYATLIA
jgi:hypothetical protein